MSRLSVSITASAVSIDSAVAALGTDPEVETGAVVTFSGVVRAGENGARIGWLDYECYPAMAEKEARAIVEEAARRWALRGAVVLHRTGRVPAGEASVVVAVAAGHRAEAFEAARYLIDELKKRVPIWKAAPQP